jgi:hypothetical protein
VTGELVCFYVGFLFGPSSLTELRARGNGRQILERILEGHTLATDLLFWALSRVSPNLLDIIDNHRGEDEKRCVYVTLQYSRICLSRRR